MAFDICRFLYYAADRRTGETFAYTVEGQRIVLVQQMAGAIRVLRANAANYDKELWSFRQVMGVTRLTADGFDWRCREAVSQPYLARFDAEKLGMASHNHARALADKLLQSGQSGRLDQFAIDVATIRILSDSLMQGRLPDQVEELAADMHTMLAYGSSYAFSRLYPGSGPDKSDVRKLARARERMLRRLTNVRADLPDGDNLLSALDKADCGDDNDIIFQHELMMMIAAGSDTSASTLGWCCLALAEHQELQTALRQEVSRLDAMQLTNPGILLRLPVLNGFVEDVLRRYPPIPMLSRRAKSADTIDQIPVRPDDLVFVSIIGIHCDQIARNDADLFSPKHYEDGEVRSEKGIPFSMGLRVCGGKRFSMIEIITVLATLVRALRFDPSGLDYGPYLWRMSMQRELGHPVKVSVID